jgi:hypothetical protein
MGGYHSISRARLRTYPGTRSSYKMGFDSCCTRMMRPASVDPDDLVCVGEVEFDDGSRRWWARYDWQALKHVSELDEDDRIEYLKLRRSK